VSLIDADPNFPLYRWKSMGQSPDLINVVTDDDREGGTIRGLIENAQEKSDFVIVDTEGTANRRVTVTALLADLVIIPFNPSPLDIAEAAKAVALLDKLAKESNTEINYILAPTQLVAVGNSKGTLKAIQQVRDAGKPMVVNALMRREAFRVMFHYGATLHTLNSREASGLPKARANARDFTNEIMTYYIGLMNEEKAVA